MKTNISIEVPDLFNLQKPLQEQILQIMRKEKRSTSRILAKKCGCTPQAIQYQFGILVNKGLIKELGYFRFDGGRMKVYEYGGK